MHLDSLWATVLDEKAVRKYVTPVGSAQEWEVKLRHPGGWGVQQPDETVLHLQASYLEPGSRRRNDAVHSTRTPPPGPLGGLQLVWAHTE